MKRNAGGRVGDGNNRSGSCSSSSTRHVGSSSSEFLQFFVRYSGGNTKVIQANANDTVACVHEQIRQKTGISVLEQGFLIYRGKHLEKDNTLEYYSIERDSHLQLVARVRSTKYPNSWKHLDRLISAVRGLCRGDRPAEAKKIVFDELRLFINMSTLFSAGAITNGFGHNQVFVSAGAATALVMLFVSPIKGNKECAEEAIKLFLQPLNSDRVTTESHTHSICIVLEFCKLLYSTTSRDNPLYISCLDTLGKMLKTIEVKLRGESFDYAKAKAVIQGSSLFVSALGRKVIQDLNSCLNSQQVAVASLLGDIRAFFGLLSPLCNVIEHTLGWMGLLPICLTGLPPCYSVELRTLHVIFLQMLGKIDECLTKIEISSSSGCHLFLLFILKSLDTLSKLYKGSEENVLSVLRSRKVALNALILMSPRSDDHVWILKHKDLTSFESRRHLTMMLLPELKGGYERLFRMLIDREQLLAKSFEYISTADVTDLVGGRIFMEFTNEKATGPGLLREWFSLVCQAIFNPQNALFVACPDDNRRFYPNPVSDVNPFHLEYFHFCGRVIALSLVYKVQAGILFDRTFILQLSEATVSLEDVRDADPLFYSSCKKILEMDTDLLDSDALGLTFVREVEKFGSRTTVELCPGGNSIALNSKNREAYVNLLVQHRFVNSVSRQVKKFAQGFSEILCDASLLAFFFWSLEHEDLDKMLHGSDRAICVEDWKAHTDYKGYKKTSRPITWFWEVVEGMSDELRRVLLFFWTSVKYLPMEGFGGLQSRLQVYKSHNSHERLPSAHTCFYQLCLPRYQSKARMQESFQIITQEHLSCSFGKG